MKRLAALLTASSALFATTAFAAIGTPTQLGTNSTTASQSTLTITTTGDCPSGSLLNVAGLIGSGIRTLSSVTDNATGGANTYTLANDANNANTLDVRVAQSLTTHDLPLGSTITLTFSVVSTQIKLGAAICTSGLGSATPDINGTGNTGTGNSPLYPASGTVTPASASELLLSVVGYNNASVSVSSPGTDGNGNSFTALQTVQNGDSLWWGYVVTSSTAGVKTNPTLSASPSWIANLVSYPGASSSCPSRAMRGVGC